MIYTFFSFFSFVSVCCFVWFCLYSFAFTICRRVLSVHFGFFNTVFNAYYHCWTCFLIWLLYSFFLLSFLHYFLIFFIFNNFLFFILITLFLFILLFPFVFSSFSSEPCGWQGLGAPAGCQACASEACAELSSGHWYTRDLPAPRNIKWQKLSQRSPSQPKDPSPLNDQQATVLDTLCQRTSRTGTQPYPLAERLPKIIIRSQTTQNTPLDAVLPTRKTRSSLIHHNTGTSPLHQEAYTTHWTNLSHWGQTPKTTGTTNLQPVKRRPQTQ